MSLENIFGGNFMSDLFKVNIKLSEVQNESGETLFDYIRDSEKEFQLEQKDVEHMSFQELEEYVNFLDILWYK
jgi:hypothetical protein